MHEAVHAKQEDVPLISILLQLPDLESRLRASALDARDDGEPGGVGGLARVEQAVAFIMPSELLDMMAKQRRNSNGEGEL